MHLFAQLNLIKLFPSDLFELAMESFMTENTIFAVLLMYTHIELKCTINRNILQQRELNMKTI